MTGPPSTFRVDGGNRVPKVGSLPLPPVTAVSAAGYMREKPVYPFGTRCELVSVPAAKF